MAAIEGTWVSRLETVKESWKKKNNHVRRTLNTIVAIVQAINNHIRKGFVALLKTISFKRFLPGLHDIQAFHR